MVDSILSNKNILSVLLITVMLLFSCSTDDFETISDWEDVTVVYGLLDQHDQAIYLKINKAFLGPGDALTYASEKDSSNYGNKLDVKIREYDPDGNLNRTLIFDTTTLYVKEEGTFYAPDQPVYFYSFADDGYAEIKVEVTFPDYDTIIDTMWLFDDYRYELEIYNQQQDKYVRAETELVRDFKITKPFSSLIGFENKEGREVTFEWDEPEEDSIFLYEIQVDFTYIEEYFEGEEDTLAINLFTSSSVNNTYTYQTKNFFTTCQNKIPYEDSNIEDNVKLRKLNDVIITVSVAEENLYKYMMVFQPSTSIVQDKPNFTNIDNGLGIFSSRYRKVKVKHVQPEGTLEDIQEFNLKF